MIATTSPIVSEQRPKQEARGTLVMRPDGPVCVAWSRLFGILFEAGWKLPAEPREAALNRCAEPGKVVQQ